MMTPEQLPPLIVGKEKPSSSTVLKGVMEGKRKSEQRSSDIESRRSTCVRPLSKWRARASERCSSLFSLRSSNQQTRREIEVVIHRNETD